VIRVGGNAADSAVASMFCLGLYNPWATGIGGGFFATIYDASNGYRVHEDARESAPHYASADMYEDDLSQSSRGPRAAAVPSKVIGLWEMKERLGNPQITWESLVQPSIDICFEGIEVGFSLAENIANYEDDIRADPGLRSVCIDPETNQPWREGDFFTWPAQGETLQRVAANGGEEFRTGVTAVSLIEDMTELGGEMDLQDLQDYE